MSELKNRGLQDILIAAVDGLTGFFDAIRTVYPATDVQLCIMHVVRNSLKFVSYKDRKAVAGGLKKIYTAATEETALAGLSEFCSAWDEKYPAIGKSWKSRWTEICPFLEYPPEIRKAIYTTNAIESLNYGLWKVTKNRLAFPTAEAAMELAFMALGNISRRWTMPIANWGQAINHLAIKFEGRVPV